MKLSNKIHLYTSAVFIVLLLLVVVTIYMAFSRMLYNGELEQALADAKQTVAGVNRIEGSVAQQDLLRAFVPPEGMIRIVSSSGDANVTITSEGLEEFTQWDSTFYQKEVIDLRKWDEERYAFVSIPLIGENGEVVALQWVESLENTRETLQVLRIVLLLAVLLAIIPVFISGRLLGNVITRPITSFIETMKDIRGSGQFKRISPPAKSKDELYQMAETFNGMMDQLEANYEKQEQFVSNASHELKTPLTVIESYSSLLKRRGREDEGLFYESVDAIHSEAERMRNLTQQLLLLAKHEEIEKVEMETHALIPILNGVAVSFEKAYQRKVRLTGEENLYVRTDQNKLKQLLYIFLDNARKYSSDSIEIQVSCGEGRAHIAILDKGIGIAERDLPKVFNRFYQVDQARTRSAGGYGLGLSLAMELSQAIASEIKLESRVGEGTTAWVILPLSLEGGQG